MSSGHGKSARARIRKRSKRSGGREDSCVGHYERSQLSIEKDFCFYSEENGDSLESFDLCFKRITQEVGVRIDCSG